MYCMSSLLHPCVDPAGPDSTSLRKEDQPIDSLARLSTLAERHQGDRRRAPPGRRVRAPDRRPHEGRAAEAGVRRAEPEPEDAGPRGGRLRPLGVERDPPVPRREEAGERSLADRPREASRREPLAVLADGALGAGLLRPDLRALREEAGRPG